MPLIVLIDHLKSGGQFEGPHGVDLSRKIILELPQWLGIETRTFETFGFIMDLFSGSCDVASSEV